MISGRLTMRAQVQRNQATGRDRWGHPVAPAMAIIGTLRCFAWSNASREAVDTDKIAMVEDLRAMFALGADITEGDELVSITKPNGTVIIPGRLQVEGPVQHKHNHLEAALKRIG